MTTVIHGANMMFALLAALAAFGSINRMNGSVSFALRLAFATVCAAMLGQVFLLLMPDQWQAAINTLAYGGIAALLIASRRRSALLSEAWMLRLSLAALAATWVLFFIGIEA